MVLQNINKDASNIRILFRLGNWLSRRRLELEGLLWVSFQISKEVLGRSRNWSSWKFKIESFVLLKQMFFPFFPQTRVLWVFSDTSNHKLPIQDSRVMLVNGSMVTWFFQESMNSLCFFSYFLWINGSFYSLPNFVMAVLLSVFGLYALLCACNYLVRWLIKLLRLFLLTIRPMFHCLSHPYAHALLFILIWWFK